MLGGILPVLDAVEIALNSADQLLDRLRRIGDTTMQPDNDCTRGKIAKIGYLLHVTEEEGGANA